MTAKAPDVLRGYFPIWGTTFDSDDVGIVGGCVVAYIPHKDEWWQVQKSDVWRERFKYDPSSLKGPKPPVCLVAGEVLKEGESFLDGLSRLGASMVDDVSDAVLALRLLKAGWFLDPELSERVFACGIFNHRLAGPYRQVFLEGVPDDAPPGYDLCISELALEKGQAAPATNVWQLIRRHRREGAHASADIAIENFHRSYGYQLSGVGRVSFLFTALDAMLGGMSARRIGEVEMKSRFRDRVVAALRALAETGAGGEVEPNAEASWLDSQGRHIRNAVAHGRPSDVATEAEEGYDRIQLLVRLLLRQYLEFGIKWAAQSKEISARFDLSAQCTPAAAYNKVLEAHAREVTDASDLLRFEISAF
jgi:hypothetical protein